MLSLLLGLYSAEAMTSNYSDEILLLFSVSVWDFAPEVSPICDEVLLFVAV